jgi:hypothetical protein
LENPRDAEAHFYARYFGGERREEKAMARQTGEVLGMLFLAHAAVAQFIQLGSKLVGSGALGAAGQGFSVGISADGNTAILGEIGDNSSGAA